MIIKIWLIIKKNLYSQIQIYLTFRYDCCPVQRIKYETFGTWQNIIKVNTFTTFLEENSWKFGPLTSLVQIRTLKVHDKLQGVSLILLHLVFGIFNPLKYIPEKSKVFSYRDSLGIVRS